MSSEDVAAKLPQLQGAATDLSPKQRAGILKYLNILLHADGGKFAQSVASRLEMTEFEVYKREEDGKTQVRAVFEGVVSEDMLNAAENMHGGCSMYLIDICSSIALVALSITLHNDARFVSQAIHTVFHAPAKIGAKLRIVNNTISFGARTVSARTEIWDMTNRRLVASGLHNQMQPSAPKL
ncbi:hypothetical protein C2E23DRAFT_842157 [Lenzites betulinus]|nr:hypothetical protein C2E23DRAFT_842157 [Lenzites betulinus]